MYMYYERLNYDLHCVRNVKCALDTQLGIRSEMGAASASIPIGLLDPTKARHAYTHLPQLLLYFGLLASPPFFLLLFLLQRG
jgi:hypothetical protein